VVFRDAQNVSLSSVEIDMPLLIDFTEPQTIRCQLKGKEE